VAEHTFQGEQLLPGVMGMEAMAQVAKTLEQSELLPEFRNLRFDHPIVIPRDKPVTIRVAALRRQPGVISLAIRCSSTGFKVEHFTGECIFAGKQAASTEETASQINDQTLMLDSQNDLYGRILFHRCRFTRIAGYESLHSNGSTARIGVPAKAPWFARHLPQELLLGDTASRDAALHSIQACIPHKTILPVGIDQVVMHADWTRAEARVHAIELSADGDNFIYDVRIEDAEGRLCEKWEGLHLRAVAVTDEQAAWPMALLVPYLERELAKITLHSGIRIGLVRTQKENQKYAIRHSIQEIFGADSKLVHRPDGKPEITGSCNSHPHISLSHAGDITLLLSTNKNAGCDLEKIVSRDSGCWENLLGKEDFALATLLASESKTSFDIAATQVWTLKESLRKAGGAFEQPISFKSCSIDGWNLFSAGGFNAATFHTNIKDTHSAFAFGFVL
jgi:enediyne polyketide synthase